MRSGIVIVPLCSLSLWFAVACSVQTREPNLTGAAGMEGGSTGGGGEGGTFDPFDPNEDMVSGGKDGLAGAGMAGGGGTHEGGGSGGSMIGGKGGSAGATAGGSGGAIVDAGPIVYDFENGKQGWQLTLGQWDKPWPQPTVSTEKVLSGTGALRFDIDPGLGKSFFFGVQTRPFLEAKLPIQRVTYNIWLPPDHKVKEIHAYILGFGSPQGRAWESLDKKGPFTGGDWIEFVLNFGSRPYPVDPMGHSLGFEVVLEPDSTAGFPVYVDDVKVEFAPVSMASPVQLQ